MSQNTDAARRFVEEAWNQGNVDVLDELCADDYVGHDPIAGDSDRDTAKELISSYRNAFPDLSLTIEDTIEEGDKVVMRMTAQGTFENELMGFQPNHERGEPIEIIGIDRFEDGKLVEAWGQWDTLQFMRDIGAIPEQAAAAS